MTCPYCGKRTKDMVSHLEKSRKCQVAHAEKLLAQRIDWLVSGDDGEESFLRRWNEEVDGDE